MSDEEAFLAAVAAAPEDEAPRLVFADWLEERGDPRGPWLRDPVIASFMGPRCENPIQRLVAGLGEDEHAFSVAVLPRIGAPAIPALLAALRTPYDYRRQAICDLLVELADHLEPFRPRLEAEADAADPEVRVAALTALGCLSDSAGLGPLVARLESSDPMVQAATLRAISDLGEAAVPYIPHILRLWRREADGRTGTGFRQAAIPTLGRVGRHAPDTTLPVLVSALAHPALAPQVPGAFDGFGEAAGPPLVQALATLDPAGARLAMQALAYARARQDSFLIEPLTNPQTPSRVRCTILRALAEGGLGESPPLMEAVTAQVRRADPAVRQAAIIAIAALAEIIPDAPARIAQAAHDSAPEVRAEAVRASARVGRLGRDSAARRALLRRALVDPAEPVRTAAWDDYITRDALRSAVRDLLDLMDEPDPDARARAAEGLGRVFTYKKPRGPGPIQLFSVAAGEDVRLQTARDNASARLIEALSDRSKVVRLAAATVLAAHEIAQPAEAHGPLVEALDDPSAAVREQAAFAIARQGLGSEPAIDLCLKLLRDEDVGVVAGALTALGTMREGRPEVDRKVRPFLRDRSARVRAAAAQALATWDGPRLDVLDDALDLIGDRNDAARAAGVRLLSRLDADDVGDRLAAHLRRALRDPASIVRSSAVAVLAERPAEFVQPFQADLVRALRAETEATGVNEIVALLQRHCPDRASDLAALLDDPSTAIRTRGLRALAGAGAALGPVVPRIVAECEHGPDETRLPALRALEGVGPAAAAAVPLLASLLETGDVETTDAAAIVAKTLGPAGEPLVGHLLEIWWDIDSENRSRAIQALAELFGDCPEALPGVREGLAHEHPEAVRYVLLSVANIGPKAGPVLPELIQLLSHADREVRWATGNVLAAIGPGAAPAVEALVAAATREHEWLAKEKLFEALGSIGPAAAAGVPLLVRAFERGGEHGLIRLRAVQSLRRIAAADVLPLWRRCLFDPDGTLREEAARALAALGPAAEPALADICRALGDRAWDRIQDVITEAGYDRRMYLLDAVEGMKTTADPVLPTLQQVLDDPNAALRVRAAEVLAALGPDAHPLLRRAAKHGDERVRDIARRALGM